MNLGIDIGGTTIKAGILDSEGNVVERFSEENRQAEGLDANLNQIAEFAEKILIRYPSVKSIGVGSPGVVKDHSVILIAPNLTGWRNVELKKYLESRLDLPTKLDNDANAAALAELKLGAGKDVNDFLFLTLGTGAGGAIVYGGKIVSGSIGGAGEIGHVIIDAEAEDFVVLPEYRKGVLEEFVGAREIVERAKNVSIGFPKTKLDRHSDFEVKDVSDAAQTGDPAAIETFRQVGFYLGIGLASAMNLLDLPIVVIGGGVSRAHRSLFDSALETIRKRSMPSTAERAELRKARFLSDAGIVGAALLGKITDEL